ncbi:hypothetical protein DFO62_12656 [Serratia fonticola]|nr:hypothetical protein DFO62_12656 [Serratia fonticola]
MVAKGFTGSETTVRDEVARWRKVGTHLLLRQPVFHQLRV